MELKTSSNNLFITGNIKTVSDFQSIKTALDSLKSTHKNINLYIEDSISITSSVIGYLNKLVLKDKIDLHMKVKDEQLMHLLEDLNLSSVFKATKV